MGLCSSKIPDGDEESTTASTTTTNSSEEEVSSKESEEKKHSVLFGEWMKVDEKPLGRGAAYVIFFGSEKFAPHISQSKNMIHIHITFEHKQGYCVSKQEFQDRTDCSDKGVFARRVERGRGDERGGRVEKSGTQECGESDLFRAFEISSVFGDGNYERR